MPLKTGKRVPDVNGQSAWVKEIPAVPRSKKRPPLWFIKIKATLYYFVVYPTLCI
jgi:hypothetical protein